MPENESAPAATIETAAPAANTAVAAPAVDAHDSKWFDENQPAMEAAKREQRGEPQPEADLAALAEADADAAPVDETKTTETAAPATGELSDDDRLVLDFFEIDPDDLPAKADRREAMLGSLRNRALEAYQEHEAASGKAPEAKPQEQQTQTQTAEQAKVKLDEAWKGVTDQLGEQVTAPVRSVVESYVGEQVKSALQPLQEQNQRYANFLTALAQRLERDDIERGFDQWQAPEGVDKSNKDVRNKVLGALKKQNRQLDLNDNSYAALIPGVAQQVFATQVATSAQKKKADAARNALRGSAESTTTAASTNPAMSQKERDDRWFDRNRQQLNKLVTA